MSKNKEKKSFRVRMIEKAITPIIDRLLRVTYDYYCNHNNIPFMEDNYEIYCQYILSDLKESEVIENG